MRRCAHSRLLGVGLFCGLAASFAAGCSDDLADSLIGEHSNGPVNNNPPGANDPLAVLAAKVPSGLPIARNLSNREYFNAISDLIGIRISRDLQKGWTATTQFSGFDAVLWNDLDAKALRDRSEAMESILEGAIVTLRVIKCAPASDADLEYSACAAKSVEPFAKRAFGRPLTDGEKASFAKTYNSAVELAKTAFTSTSDIFREGVRTTLGSVLLAPQFMSRIETPPSETFVGERDLNSYEIADRLAFTFLGTLPDDQLWAKAEDGSLASPDVVESEVRRFLDTKSETFVQTFMGQWFDFRTFDSKAANSIENAMWQESWHTLNDILKNDLPVASMVAPGFTYVNKQLAEYYGIPGDFTDEFVRVETSDRGGVLQQGAWLTLSATALKTSPMHRGRMVQDRLLCKVIPPPDSALFEKIQMVSASIPANATVKQRVESHRNAGEACFGCHQYMDPIGIGLEGFDQFGKVRATYADTGFKVETDSNLLGIPFATASELSQKLAVLPDYTRCAAEKLTVFSTRKAVHASSDDADLIAYLAYAPPDKPAPSLREMMFRLVRSKAFRTVNHVAKVPQ